jgi:16S rRNA (cytidine1402-2'-O)-methyltransferase
MSVAGVANEGASYSGFVFVGFLSSKTGERATAIAALEQEARAVVMLEAPHRIEALATALVALGSRSLTVGRELTKQFEEIATMAASDFTNWLQCEPHRSKGEFVLVLHPAPVVSDRNAEQRILKLLMAKLPLKMAVKLTGEITGAPRNDLYDAALILKKLAA